jgi:nucleotide-binding universal stress UspA family protein
MRVKFLLRSGSMFNRILVCLDGSKLAEEILPCVMDAYSGKEREFILLEVIADHITIPSPESTHVMTFGIDSKPDQIHTTDMGKTTTLEPKANLQLREIEREQLEANIRLESLAKPLQGRGFKVKTMTIPGEAGETILNYAHNENVSLIALTTHGKGGLKRNTLGRVTQYILKESVIPVLTFNPKGTKG